MSVLGIGEVVVVVLRLVAEGGARLTTPEGGISLK
jgi:hypothetical protein